MKTDNTNHLTAATRRRSEETRRRAEAALRAMDSAGEPISYTTVAAAASVSRSWLYRHPALREEIDRLRAAAPTVASLRPAVERGSAASQHRRVTTLLDANRVLRDENQHLRTEVAVLLGERRDHVCGLPL